MKYFAPILFAILLFAGCSEGVSPDTQLSFHNSIQGRYRLDAIYYEHFSDFLEIDSNHEIAVGPSSVEFFLDGVSDHTDRVTIISAIDSTSFVLTIHGHTEHWNFNDPKPGVYNLQISDVDSDLKTPVPPMWCWTKIP